MQRIAAEAEDKNNENLDCHGLPRIVRSQVVETADGTLGQSHIDRGEESRLAD
jgi:hypothetical protein